MTATIAAIRRNTEKTEGVRTSWEVVTPELATKWLEGNTHNRSVRDAVVARYAADMLAGRWLQTHQGIAFDEESTLIDGQHRLFAIIESSTPVRLQVTRGLSLETQVIVDDGIPRTIVDVARLSDPSMAGGTPLHTAVSHRMFMGLSQTTTARTKLEKLAFMKKHWEAVSFGVSLFPMPKRVKGLSSAAMIAVFAMAFHHEDRATLQRAAKVLIDGMSADALDFGLIKLRNFLLTRGRSTGSQGGVDVYAKTERAVYNYCHKQPMSRNLVPASVELYPLPTGKGR